MTTDDTLYVERDVLDLLVQVNLWCRNEEVCAAFTDFFANSPPFIFEGCPGYPEKIYEKKFLRDWDKACAFMIEHHALENRGWPGRDHVPLVGNLYAARVRKLLARTKATPERIAAPTPTETQEKAPMTPEKPALQVPSGSTIHPVFDGADLHIDTDEGPKALRKAIEEKIDELRARLQGVFNHSITGGPMPWQAALCIAETTLCEHPESEELAGWFGDFFSDIVRIKKNPIRYASWLACSELLSKVRAATKGLTRTVDSCMVEEYESALRDLGVGAKP